MRIVHTLVLITVLSLAGPLAATQKAPMTDTLTQDELFKTTRVWEAHLRFTPEAWKGVQAVPGEPTRIARDAGEWLQGRQGSRNGWAAARGFEFNYVPATLEFDSRVFKDVAVRIKGNGTYNPNSINSLKLSYKVDLNKHVKGQKLAGVSTLNFHNNISDPGWVNEVLAHRLFRDAGAPAPRTSYVRLSLSVPGEHDRRYLGLYSLVENVDGNFLQSRYSTRDGVLLKPTTMTPFKDLGDDWRAYVQSYDPKTDMTPADERRVIAFCRLVTSGSDAEFAAQAGDYVDIAAFARFMAVTAWMNNWDSILRNGQNYYVFVHPKTQKMHFITWDHDHSFGIFNQQPEGSHPYGPLEKPWPETVRFLERMFSLKPVRDAYFASLRELSKTVFVPSRFPPQLKEISDAIRPVLAFEPPKVQQPRTTPELQTALFDQVVNGEIRLMPFVLARARFVQSELARLGK
jgi:hypothetical protein